MANHHLIFLQLVNAAMLVSGAYGISSNEAVCDLQKSISIHTAGCQGDGSCPFGNLENSYGSTIIAGRSANADFTLHSCGADPNRPLLEPVGGASKLVTTIVMMKLVEENLLSLDEPLSTWFDWWTTDPNDNRSLVTLRHLLSMTSGFGYIPCTYDSQNQNETNLACSKKIYNTYGLFQTGRMSMGGWTTQSTCYRPNNMTDEPNTILPGQYFCYDESPWNVAAALALQVTGMDIFNDVYEQYLATPLGINVSECSYNGHSEDAYFFGGTPRNVDAGTDLSCKATEYSKILGAYFVGDILSDSSMQEMESVQTTNLSLPMSALTPAQVDFVEKYTTPEYGLGLWHINGTRTSQSFSGVLPLINREVGYWALLFREGVQGDQESIDAVYEEEGILSKLNALYNDNPEESDNNGLFSSDSCSDVFNCSISNPLGPCIGGFCVKDGLELNPDATFMDFRFSTQNCGVRDALIQKYHFGFQCEFLSGMRERYCCTNASISNSEATATAIEPTATTTTPINASVDDEGTAPPGEDGDLPPYITDPITSSAPSLYGVWLVHIKTGIMSLMIIPLYQIVA